MRDPGKWGALAARYENKPQRRLLALDGFFAMALLEAPLVGISSEAVAVAPLLIASLAGLHLAAAVSGRRRQR